MLDQENCEVKIKALTYQDWQPLLVLIPEIEKKKLSTSVVEEFLELVYHIPIIISFDWMAWDEGVNMASIEFDFDTVDLVTKCKLITAIVRNDRFSEGALVSAFENGLILKILKSIEKQVNLK